MDSYSEQLVQKYPTSKDTLKKVLIYVGAGVLAIVFLLLGFMVYTFMPICILLVMGIVYGAYYLGKRQYIEYEYLITNGEIDIDKIIGKDKRVRLITVKASSFTAFGELTDDVKDDESLTVVLASDNIGNADWYADFETEQYGQTRLIFTPNQAFIESIKPFLNQKLRLKKH